MKLKHFLHNKNEFLNFTRPNPQDSRLKTQDSRLKTQGIFCLSLTLLAMFGFSHQANAALTDGLVAYYPFNGNANDESGNNLNGIENGAISYEQGIAGKALKFDGTSTYINAGNSPLLNVNNHSIVAWINPNQSSTENSIIGKVKPYTYETIQFYLVKNHLETAFATGTEVNHAIRDPKAIANNKWTQVVMTYDGNSVNFYIDGVLSGKEPRTGTVRTNTNLLAIGRHGGDAQGSDSYFNGMIDELRIYNRALNADEVAALYGNTVVTPPTAACPDLMTSFYPATGTLCLPRVEVGAQHYSATLKLMNTPNTTNFKLDSASPIASGGVNNASFADGLLKLPAVAIPKATVFDSKTTGFDLYKASLTLIPNSDPYIFTLISADKTGGWVGNSTDNPNIPSTLSIPVEFQMPVSGTLPPKPLPILPPVKILPNGSTSGCTSTICSNRSELTALREELWNPGDILRVFMDGGSVKVREKVRQFASEWMKYANIHFEFVDHLPAEIRVGFVKEGSSSWSHIGRYALNINEKEHTMNFGWFDDYTGDTEFSRVVLHEFGHALGLVHEQSSPDANIQWNKEVVYKALAGLTPPWDKAKVDSNYFYQYSASSTNYSEYDSTSIMHYSIPPQYTVDNKGIGSNITLSENDKSYIQKWYPTFRQGLKTNGQLKTGDDCDEIDFQVEYDVVSQTNIEFKLNPGEDVTWWKLVEIPSSDNKYKELQINKGFFDKNLPTGITVSKDELDSSRAIRFWKAKFAGVHTLLDYNWAILWALPGGSRVTLNWNRDHCP